MKKNKNLTLSAAALMLATAGLTTACSSEDVFDGGNTLPADAVKTQFAINVPAGSPGRVQGRMSDKVTQANDPVQFRGMSNIQLIPFSGITLQGDTVPGRITFANNAIALDAITTAGKDGLSTAGSDRYKVYSDIAIPTNTNAFLFYGEATDDTDASDKVNGALDMSGLTVGNEVSGLTFSLRSILGGQSVTTQQQALLDILNDLSDISDWSTQSGNDLASLYTSFTGLKAGSANSIRLAIQDLYNSVKDSRLADVLITQTEGTTSLKGLIATHIEKFFTPAGTGGDQAPYTLTYKTANTYPQDLGLPDGAVQVAYSAGTGTGSWSYTTQVDYDGSLAGTMNVAALDDYVFPASLYYRTNTNIGTSNSLYFNAASPSIGNSWSDIISNTNYPDNSVSATTQSVVLKKKIQYAVGRFDVNARFTNEPLHDADEATIAIPDGGFTLTGVLIGGQKNVDFAFAPVSSAAEKTIYDAAVGTNNDGFGVTTSAQVVNRTLVLQTAGSQTPGQESVNFALEFVNNSPSAFKGVDGIVPVGGKFYLVGRLTNTAAHHNVFFQDHNTIATVTINSLKNAYNCVPDLRAPKLELGLSVDLEWQEGLKQDVTIE